MKSKYKYVLIILGVLLIIIGGYYLMCNNNSVKVGNTYFPIPEGYSVIDTGKYYNFTSGNNSMCIRKDIESNVKVSMDNYVKNKREIDNVTVEISNFDVNGVSAYKGTLKEDPRVQYYWFDTGGNVYIFYTWSANSNSDALAKMLFESRKVFI